MWLGIWVRIEVGGNTHLQSKLFQLCFTNEFLLMVDKGILRGLMPFVRNWLQHSKGRITK